MLSISHFKRARVHRKILEHINETLNCNIKVGAVIIILRIVENQVSYETLSVISSDIFYLFIEVEIEYL